MGIKNAREQLREQLEDVLLEIKRHDLGLIIENDTILLVSEKEVERARRKKYDPVYDTLPSPVQVVNDLKKVEVIDDSGALLGAGAA